MNIEQLMRRADQLLPGMMASSLPRTFMQTSVVSENSPGMQVDTRDMQSFCYVVPIEPHALSLPIDSKRGHGEGLIRSAGSRTVLPFQRIISPVHQLEKQSLGLNTTHTVANILRNYAAAPLLDQENKQFLRHAASAAGLSTFRVMKADSDLIQCVKDGGFENTLGVSDSRVFNAAVYARMMTSLLRKQVQLRSFLMHLDTFEAAVDSLGLGKTVEVSSEGVFTASNSGIELRTPAFSQMDCIKPGHVYGFGDKACLGQHATLCGPKYYVGPSTNPVYKEAGYLDAQSWEVVAMGITLTDACTVMVLADAEPMMVEVSVMVDHRGYILLGE